MASGDKRNQIIDAALSIMADKGSEMTNTEIAAMAGVNESIIYHYFKNKEDLLFHAAGESLRSRTEELQKQLQGIRDPVSRLSKLIWFQLWYHDNEPQYAKFSIFHCRASKNFYAHHSVCHFTHWFNILTEILYDGIDAGAFSSDLNVLVAAEAIFGLMDMGNILLFTGQESGTGQEDFDEILDLILPMLSRSAPEIIGNGGKRKIILNAAEQIFADKGFDKATTIEIARLAGVAEGTLYGYFKSKEDILFSVLQDRFQGNLKIQENSFETKRPVEKLRRFMQDHFVLYLRNPAFAKTFISGGIYNPHFYDSAAYQDFRKYMATIDTILEEGKVEGSFRPEINSRIFKDLFLGAFCNLVLRWLYPCSDRRPDMMRLANEAVTLLMQAAVGPDHKQNQDRNRQYARRLN